jgi:hypothetical protein
MVAAWTLMSAESFDIAFDGKRLFTKLRERSDFCPDNFGIRWASLVITCNCGGKIYVGAPHPRDQIIPTRLRGRATMSSTRHLSQFSVPQWDFETTSACFRLTFLWRESAWLKTFFLITQHGKAKEIFFTHGTSNFRRKLEIDWSFQLVSYLGFIVLWVLLHLSLCVIPS